MLINCLRNIKTRKECPKTGHSIQKGDIVAFEEENIKHTGILLSGAVDIIEVVSKRTIREKLLAYDPGALLF